MAASFPPEIERAAKLPLNDAALLLWLRRRQLQRWDGRSSSPRLSGDAMAQIGQAMHALQFERANATNGPTFDRLKRAHPRADESALKEAIERAVRLEADCVKHFVHSNAGVEEDAKRAVERARDDNPGFLDEAYEAVTEHLRTSMR